MTKWDEKYLAGYGAKNPAEPSLINATSAIPPGRALDLACGLGRNGLYLAAQGWHVTALDSSQVAIDSLPQTVDAHLVDLEAPDFRIALNSYDLICDCYYLDRNLFPQIRDGVKRGGLFVGVIPMVDEDPTLHPMNPAYLCSSGELRSCFSGWEILHDYEGKPAGDASKRKVAELTARKR